VLIPPARFPPIPEGSPVVEARLSCGLLESVDVCGPRFLLRIGFVLVAASAGAILLADGDILHVRFAV